MRIHLRPRPGAPRRRGGRCWTPVLIIAVLAAGPAAFTASLTGTFVVHEWGTFVSMEGSDGLALEGLHHDEADLPAFVHSRGRDQLRLHATTSKLETPVLYFYTDPADGPKLVHVRVDFPEGIITQWYPQASLASPRLLQGDVPTPLRGGYMEWSASLIPEWRSSLSDPVGLARFPQTEPGDVWNFTRQTQSAFVTSSSWDWQANREVSEQDKFIFYRGLGSFVPPLRAQSSTEGRLTLANIGGEPLHYLFLLRVEGGKGAYQYFPTLQAGQQINARITMDADAAPLDQVVGRLGQALKARLIEQGLFDDEAQAMVNTWSRSYFRTPGTRVLYAVPRTQIDRTLPLDITGFLPQGDSMAPEKLERVFVGRVECMTPEEEQRIEGWLRDLGSSNVDRAAAARNGLIALGRFAEPYLRRALQNSPDPVVRTRAQVLLHSDALDELIAAERAFPSNVDVSARLAALQRRAGLNDEAKAKGEAALAVLQAHVPPQPAANGNVFDGSDPARRRWLRSMAFAREAIGDPGPTADAYGEFVRFASGLNGQTCQSCHADALVKPITYSDLRDWWGGERFRTFAKEAEKADALIAAARKQLTTDPTSTEALLTLAYLLPARGETEAAQQAWDTLDSLSP